MSITPIVPTPENFENNQSPVTFEVNIENDYANMIEQYGLGAILTVEYLKDCDGWTPDEIRDALAKEGLNDSVVTDINPTTAIADTRAAFRGVKILDKPTRAEIVHRDAKKKLLTIALLSRDVQDKKSTWKTFDTLEFDYNQCIFTLQGTTEAAVEFRNRASHRLTHYKAGMFSKNIINGLVASWSGFNYDVGGKNKYVPQSFLSEVDRLKKACNRLGGVRIKVANQLATPDSKESIGDVAKSTLLSKIEWCRTTMDLWRGRDKIRSSSQENVFGEMERIASQMVVLKEALELEVGSLESNLDEIRETALLLVNEKNTSMERSILEKLMLKEEYELDTDFWVIPIEDFPFKIRTSGERVNHKGLCQAAKEMNLIIASQDDSIILTSFK